MFFAAWAKKKKNSSPRWIEGKSNVERSNNVELKKKRKRKSVELRFSSTERKWSERQPKKCKKKKKTAMYRRKKKKETQPLDVTKELEVPKRHAKGITACPFGERKRKKEKARSTPQFFLLTFLRSVFYGVQIAFTTCVWLAFRDIYPTVSYFCLFFRVQPMLLTLLGFLVSLPSFSVGKTEHIQQRTTKMIVSSCGIMKVRNKEKRRGRLEQVSHRVER